MPSPHPRIRSWRLALVFLASFVFSGCTVNLDRVDQPTLAGTRQAVTGRMDMEIVSGGTAEARAGWVAVLMPADWTVATSTYYVSPLRATDTQTNLVATTTLDAPMEAPDGYQWFMAHTPGTESPISGRRYMAVINMVTGDALGTYTLRYYAGEPDSSWTSSATQTIEVRSNPCGEESSPSDADGDGYREIYTLCQLQDMQDDLTANYELMADLDVNAVGNELFAASGVGFMPVGSVATPFSGRFDGHHRTITGLRIYRPDAIGVGLFGSVTGRVMNLRVVGAGVAGANAVGVIAGSMSYTGSFLQEVSVTGHATGTDMVGGLVGNMLQGTIERSYADVDVSSVEGVYIGGLVGTMTASRLENVYSTGEIVTSGRYVGGLVGYDTTEAAGSILQSYAVGSVIGNEYVGGLAGYNDQDDIAYSFSAAVPSVLIDTPTLGGLVGGENLDETAFLYTHNYWFAEGDIPTIGIGNYSEHTSSTKWEVIDSPSAFKGAPSNAPFTTGGVRRWDPSIWSFPSGAYPKLVAFSVFSLEYTAEEGGVALRAFERRAFGGRRMHRA